MEAAHAANVYRIALTLVVVALSACAGGGGGFSCPVSTPSCCYDGLFGCGPFDLPQGCSCSQYGFFRSFKQTVATKSLSGSWNGTLVRESATCPGLLAKVSGGARVKEKGSAVTMSIPGYGTLRGRKQKNGFTASGRYRPALSFCAAQISVSFVKRTNTLASVRTGITYTCGALYSCSAKYSGQLKRSSV